MYLDGIHEVSLVGDENNYNEGKDIIKNLGRTVSPATKRYHEPSFILAGDCLLWTMAGCRIRNVFDEKESCEGDVNQK
jgi:hypothetical protein